MKIPKLTSANPQSKQLLLCIGAIFLIIALSFTGWYIWKHRHPSLELVAHGNVDIRQVDLGFRVNGRITDMNFEEGDLVKKGQVLAILDKTPYQNDLALAKSQVAQAKADMVKKKAGNRLEEIKQAEDTLKERQATYDNAVTTFKRLDELVKSGATSKQLADDAETRRNEAEARLQNAKDTFQLMKEGFRVEDIDAAIATYALAKDRVAIAQTSLEDTEIIAPSNGVIFSRVREPGAVVPAGATVYTLSLRNPTWVRAYISEIDLGHVKPGVAALIYTDSHKHPFTGKVGYISPQAEFTPKNIETKELRPDLVYRIRIITEDPQEELRQGMPVTVKVLLTPSS